MQAMRAEEGAQHSRPSPIKKQCAPKREIGDCAKKSQSAEPNAATKVGAAATIATSTTVHTAGIGSAPRATLRKKIADVTRELANLTKLSVCGVKGKIESFNFHDTALDKNPVLLKKQQSIDPFVQAINFFLTDKVLPTKRYRYIITTW